MAIIALALIMLSLGTILFALLYWLIGKGTAEGEPPTFVQGLSAAVVPGLVMVPYLLLVSFICLVKPIGGLGLEKLSPTSLGYYLHVENPRLHSLLYRLDVFNVAVLVLTFLAARHLLRLKVLGAVACTVALALWIFVLPALSAKG